MKTRRHLSGLLLVIVLLATGCTALLDQPAPPVEVPHEDRWGIFALDLSTQGTALLYSSPNRISNLRLNGSGDRFVFSQRVGGDTNEQEEILTLGVDGQDLRRLTENDFWDIYPAWSPDGSRIAFLSWRESDLDIYVMGADGSQVERLFDSGDHDADIHWVGDLIVFTSGSRIWGMRADGTEAGPLTDPPRVGEWGNVNLPFGDYDPRISPDGSRIVFERLSDDTSPHGNYDLYLMDADGSNLVQLTSTGHSQGLASWSHAGDRLVFIVAAVGEVGQYDIYIMNADGNDNHNITPDTFPAQFLCHSPIFSLDDGTIYFVGEWWPEE